MSASLRGLAAWLADPNFRGSAQVVSDSTSIGHIGGNAEDCPACYELAKAGVVLPYPWICPGGAA